MKTGKQKAESRKPRRKCRAISDVTWLDHVNQMQQISDQIENLYGDAWRQSEKLEILVGKPPSGFGNSWFNSWYDCVQDSPDEWKRMVIPEIRTLLKRQKALAKLTADEKSLLGLATHPPK